MSENEKVPFIILGRIIGYGSGFDSLKGLKFTIYDFVPASSIEISACSALIINFEKGLAEIYDENGEVDQSWDLINVLKGICSRYNTRNSRYK